LGRVEDALEVRVSRQPDKATDEAVIPAIFRKFLRSSLHSIFYLRK